MRATKLKSNLPQGVTITNLKILERLHNTMKTLRQIRQDQEGSGVKLNRIYREAVEMYINAKPQQLLLKEYADGSAKPGRSPASRLTAGV